MDKGLKKLFIGWLLVLLLLLFIPFNGQEVKADGYSPELSGGYQTGQGLYEEEGEEYRYTEGWLKYKLKLSGQKYYYIKFRYLNKDYLLRDYYDSLTRYYNLVYRFPLSKKIYSRVEGSCVAKDYSDSENRDYHSLSTTVDFNWKWSSDIKFSLSLQGKQWWYPSAAEKNERLFSITNSWDFRLFEPFEVKCRYGLTWEDEFSLPHLADRKKEFVSISFVWDL